MIGVEHTIPVGDLPEVLAKGQCMGCGFCTIKLDHVRSGESPSTTAEITYRWFETHEHWGPDLSSNTGSFAEGDRRICPGAIMDMPALAQDVFEQQPNDEMLGEALSIAVGHAISPDIRRNAASGGITTALLTRLFDIDAIDVAYCVAGRDPKNGGAILARGPKDLVRTCGSHYHPVAFGQALGELVSGKERFAFVGLPCEVSAMRQLMSLQPEIEKRCKLLIGLFCGGINRYSGIGRYLKHFNIQAAKVTEIDYREGTWPGQICASIEGETALRRVPRIRGNSRWNILHYMVSFQGYWMLPRCRICPDQLADFADISVGDPHLPRFKLQDSDGYSAVVARTSRGLSILEDSETGGFIKLAPLTRDELVNSQGYTLENRRHALVYVNMAKRLGMEPPTIHVYASLRKAISKHQYVFAFVDLVKIRYRKHTWLRPFYLPIQIFEYVFLTFSPRVIIARILKLTSNR